MIIQNRIRNVQYLQYDYLLVPSFQLPSFDLHESVLVFLVFIHVYSVFFVVRIWDYDLIALHLIDKCYKHRVFNLILSESQYVIQTQLRFIKEYLFFRWIQQPFLIFYEAFLNCLVALQEY